MRKDFLVLGLCGFGRSVCKELYHLGDEVLAVDWDTEKVNAMKNDASCTVVADATSERD